MSLNQKTINRKFTGKEKVFSTNITYKGHRIYKGLWQNKRKIDNLIEKQAGDMNRQLTEDETQKSVDMKKVITLTCNCGNAN